MRAAPKKRAEILGKYIADTGATVRRCAEFFGVSMSTEHSDVTKNLRDDNPVLYERVRTVLDINKSERHIRGGMATREKYKGL